MTRRETVDVGGVPISYLTAGKGGPLVLLLHGTYWSRVWQPVLDGIAAAGLRPVAVDFPGFGRSGGELTAERGFGPASLRLAAALPRRARAQGPGHGRRPRHRRRRRAASHARKQGGGAAAGRGERQSCTTHGRSPALPASGIRLWPPRRRGTMFSPRVAYPS